MTQKFEEDIILIYPQDKSERIVLDNEGMIIVKYQKLKSSVYIRPNGIQINDENSTMRYLLESKGVFIINNKQGEQCFRIDGNYGNIRMGGNNQDGDLLLFPRGGDPGKAKDATVHINGETGNIRLGANGADGDIIIFPENSDIDEIAESSIHLNGSGGNIHLGGKHADGDIFLYAKGDDKTSTSTARIHLDGQIGDIKLSNADCAENFLVENKSHIEPGSVMVIGSNSYLKISEKSYDSKVAGIVSGAGDLRPGIVLGHSGDVENKLPIALSGRVNCLVDADYEPVNVGDILTTSDTPGHAMKVSDPYKSIGAVIGKALKPMESGKGLIPVLVTLQ